MTKNFETRGGARQKKRLYSSQARFLEVLWKQFGGITLAAKKIQVSRQLLLNWKLDSKVPLEWCGKVSKALSISIYALNYEEVSELLYGKETPDWKDLVKKYVHDECKEYVLNGNFPKDQA